MSRERLEFRICRTLEKQQVAQQIISISMQLVTNVTGESLIFSWLHSKPNRRFQASSQ
jgi:hypothetical protein